MYHKNANLVVSLPLKRYTANLRTRALSLMRALSLCAFNANTTPKSDGGVLLSKILDDQGTENLFQRYRIASF